MQKCVCSAKENSLAYKYEEGYTKLCKKIYPSNSEKMLNLVYFPSLCLTFSPVKACNQRKCSWIPEKGAFHIFCNDQTYHVDITQSIMLWITLTAGWNIGTSFCLLSALPTENHLFERYFLNEQNHSSLQSFLYRQQEYSSLEATRKLGYCELVVRWSSLLKCPDITLVLLSRSKDKQFLQTWYCLIVYGLVMANSLPLI